MECVYTELHLWMRRDKNPFPNCKEILEVCVCEREVVTSVVGDGHQADEDQGGGDF